MTREEFNELATFKAGVCPDCKTRKQEPHPGCGCPASESGYGTTHIFKYHHKCPKVNENE